MNPLQNMSLGIYWPNFYKRPMVNGVCGEDGHWLYTGSHGEFWPNDPRFSSIFCTTVHGSLKKSKPTKKLNESLEIQRPEDIPGYHEYQKFVNLLVEGIDYEDFGKNKCEPKFVEMYMMRTRFNDDQSRQKSGIKKLIQLTDA